MINQSLTEFARMIGLSCETDFAYGTYNGYFITVYNSGQNKSAFINFYEDEEKTSIDSFEFTENLTRLSSEGALNKYELDSNGIYIETAQALIEFRTLIDSVTSLLKEYGFRGADVCSSCGKAFTDERKRVFASTNNYLLCPSCSLNAMVENEQKAAEAQHAAEGASIPKAVLFSLLAALGIGIVFVFFYKFIIPEKALWGNFLPGYFAAFIPLGMAAAAMLIYKANAKRVNALNIISSFLICIVVLFAAQYIGSVLLYLRAEDITANQVRFAFDQICKLPFVDDAVKEGFVKCLILDYCVAAIGIFVFSFVGVKGQKVQKLNVSPYTAEASEE